ncbi:hypothetical protein GGR53DRAFT_469076 [Hypoxylon sp. FL1150]|nr:hypothetical protein GGR53DRAFT_469076 [Hypoxylon sp. FL1150]
MSRNGGYSPHMTSRPLDASTRADSLEADVLTMLYEVLANTIEPARFMPLIGAVLKNQPNVNIWCKVYDIAATYTG